MDVSEVSNVEIEIPQGTPLSWLMFILYINKMVPFVRHCKIRLFADDALLWIDADDFFTAANLIQSDLVNIVEVLVISKLKLNLPKIKTKAIGAKQDDIIPTVSVCGENIDRVFNFKYLGLIIDQNLKFKKYLDCIKKKIIIKKVGLLGRVRRKLDMRNKLLLLNSYG